MSQTAGGHLQGIEFKGSGGLGETLLTTHHPPDPEIQPKGVKTSKHANRTNGLEDASPTTSSHSNGFPNPPPSSVPPANTSASGAFKSPEDLAAALLKEFGEDVNDDEMEEPVGSEEEEEEGQVNSTTRRTING
jgi:hypothetical protein